MFKSLNTRPPFIITYFIQAVILFLFIFPLFIQLSGSVFDNTGMRYESFGQILQIPIPIAVIFCFIGIMFLLRLEKNYFGTEIIFSVFILMILSIVISADGSDKGSLPKFVLLVQFALPLFAFIFGQLYKKPAENYLRYEAICLYMLLAIVPLEVFATILQKTAVLTPYLYYFSLYQHLDYLPEIFVGLYFLSVTLCYEKRSRFLQYGVWFLSPWMGAYVAALDSYEALLLPLICILVSAITLYKRNIKSLLYIPLLIFGFFAYNTYHLNLQNIESKDIAIEKNLPDKQESFRLSGATREIIGGAY